MGPSKMQASLVNYNNNTILHIYLKIQSSHTIPANCETSIKNDNTAAPKPVTNVLLTGTWVLLFTSEKNDGSNPSLAIAIKIRGWGRQKLC
jgi:hypothetical protein